MQFSFCGDRRSPLRPANRRVRTASPLGQFSVVVRHYSVPLRRPPPPAARMRHTDNPRAAERTRCPPDFATPALRVAPLERDPRRGEEDRQPGDDDERADGRRQRRPARPRDARPRSRRRRRPAGTRRTWSCTHAGSSPPRNGGTKITREDRDHRRRGAAQHDPERQRDQRELRRQDGARDDDPQRVVVGQARGRHPVGGEDGLRREEHADAEDEPRGERDRRHDDGLRGEHAPAPRRRGQRQPDHPGAVLGRRRLDAEHEEQDRAEDAADASTPPIGSKSARPDASQWS